MTDDGWEARMSARAAARRPAPNVEARVWYGNLMRQDIARIRATMTLGALAYNLRAGPSACACIGPPFCCINRGVVQRELQRSAHIVARLLLDAASKRDGSTDDA